MSTHQIMNIAMVGHHTDDHEAVLGSQVDASQVPD